MYVPSGAFEATLRASDTLAFREYVARANRFSFGLFRQRVTSEPGAAVQAKIATALSTLLPIEIREMYAAHQWLGTSTRASLIVVADLDERMRAKLSAAPDPFSALGPWEDLALYSAHRILLATCSHEREATAYGTELELRRLGLDPKPARPPAFVASPLNGEVQLKIAALARAIP